LIIIAEYRKVYKAILDRKDMLSIKKISEVVGKSVYTDAGDFLGQVEETNLADNRIDGWRIRIAAQVSHLIGGARGIVIPHQYVKAIGDVFIVNKSSLPIRDEIEMPSSEQKIELQ